MRAQLQNFYVLRLMLNDEERRFFDSFCKVHGLEGRYTEISSGTIFLDEDQIRQFRLALAKHKPGDAREELLHREFWESIPDFTIVSEERDAYYDDLPLKATPRASRGGDSGG